MPYLICSVCHKSAGHIKEEEYEGNEHLHVCKEDDCPAKGYSLDVQHFLGHNPWGCDYCKHEKEAIKLGVCNVGRSQDFYQCCNIEIQEELEL